MTISAQLIASLLTKLRLAYEPHRRMAPADMAAQTAVYADVLKDLEPSLLSAAVERMLRVDTKRQRLPTPAELRQAAVDLRAFRQRQAAASQTALPGPGQPVDGGALRNEAIMLLGGFDLVMRRTLDEEAYRYVLAECASWWQSQRPEGGLDALGQQRLWVGRALEDYARARLGMPPLPSLEMAPTPWTARPKPPRGAGLRSLQDILRRELPVEAAE
jgi:beta-glucosidase-like glycosyl hydrolase